MTQLLFDDLITRLTMPNVLTGIILAVLGLAVVFLARKLTKVIRKTKEVKVTDHLYMGIKAFGLIMIIVALIVMIIK